MNSPVNHNKHKSIVRSITNFWHFRLAIILVLVAALWGAGLRLPRTSADTGTGSISLTTLGSPSTENFDTLSNTAGSTTNTALPTGWYITETGGGARDNEQYGVDTGASTTGDIYSYGAAASTERALGELRSGTLIPLFGAKFTNNTGATVTSLAVSYTGEQWRFGGVHTTVPDRLDFQYSVNATDLSTGTYLDANALDFSPPITAGTAGALDGNAAANRTAISSTITGLSIPNGATFFIRWTDADATGADDGLAVDGFSLTPNAAAALPNLTINDVSLNEGNAGTTSFTFTVSLSAPAGPGGATFDIATADNSAVAPGDYTAKSLTGQTIPAGSSTYSFTVLVNGDTTPETNETFFVNVANITGAIGTDTTGLGTIVNDDAAPNLTINDVTLNEGNAGTTTFTFTVSLSTPAGAGGVTFDIATANNTAIAPGDYTAKTLTAQTIPAGSSTYTFDVLVNGDLITETDETFNVNVTNVTNAITTDGQGLGTIVNDDITKIHDVQGNGAATPIPGATVTVEGVVIANFQGAAKLQGFFLQEEDADADADPNTSEGIFIFCSPCSTAVAEGQRVRATGVVSEFNGMTEITASAAGSVVITDAGNHLAEVTAAQIDLPIAGDVNSFYEAREAMLVTFVDTLTVSEYFELARFGQIELFEGGRPSQFTETSAPSVAGLTAHLDNLDRRRVILDDDNNAQEAYLSMPDGSQSVFYPRANGGFSVGTQGVDFFRGGDLVNGLTGVLHWSFPGFGADTWRIRPTAAHPATFTVANPRPATPPAVGGAIKAVGMNLLNYFTTIDTTSSTTTGPCGPSGTQDCRGADSVAELNRQRERASIVICSLNADVYAFMELENTTPNATITDLLGAVNARCGGAHPYAFVNTGGTLGTDAIRVQMIYRTGIVSPVGSPIVDLDPIHNRPPTAQTFDVVDAANPAFGKRFTVIANHFKSKGCDGSATGADADTGDGQSCYNGRRTAQAARLLSWINSTVLPAAGDPDILLLGDFNSYAKEDPVTTLTSGGFVDLASALLGAGSYSYLFDAQLGHLDYAFASSSLSPQITGVGNWHINADECDLFDYNDEVKDTGESTFEEKPDGSALVPPRVVFQPATPYRASDHDPVIVGLFQVSDLAITKMDTPDPVTAGTNLTYTITVTNNGPDAATNASWTDTLPAGTTFVSLSTQPGWTNTTPAVGAGGTITVTNPSFAVGSAMFTLVVKVDASVTAGTVITNTATVSSSSSDGMPNNQMGTATTTVAASADLTVTKLDMPDPVTAGNNITYTITVTNNGPSNAASVSLSDTLPPGTTFVSHSAPGGWSCMTPAVGAGGTVSCTIGTLPPGTATFTLVVAVGTGVANGTVISNTATASSATTDPNPENGSATATTTVQASADLAVTKSDSPDPVNAGENLTYTINFVNNGPNPATGVTVTDSVPANTTFVSAAVTTGSGWTTSAPAVGMTGNVVFSKTPVASGESAVFTIVVKVNVATPNNTIITNSATAASTTPDSNGANNTGTTTTTVSGQADLAVTKTDSPDPICVNGNLTYTITLTNGGPGSSLNATVTDPVPANTTLVSATTSSPGWARSDSVPAGGTGNVVFSKSSVANGETATFQMVVKVNAGTVHGTVISNSATAASSTQDPNGGNNAATATTTVDPIPPTFTNGCSAPINRAASASCPFAAATTVTYATPAVSDNCSATVACVPPSGSVFPVGTTTVTCTATDTAGNTATCTFPVTVFSTCLQDNSNSGSVVLIDASTGAYRFCCNGVLVASGTGTRNVRGCVVTISDSSNNRVVQISVDGASMKGTASVKQGGAIVCTITDSNLQNNVCMCQ